MPNSKQTGFSVQTVDLKNPDAPKQFVDSLLNTGFAVLRNHPISFDLIKDAFAEWQRFFASQEKFDHTFEAKIQAGYFPFRAENAKDYSIKDLKEFYHYYPTRKALPAMCSTATPRMYNEMLALGTQLLGWIEEFSPQEVRSRFPVRLKEMIRNSEDTVLRALHYPPLTGGEEEGAVRAAAHEDINLITLLPAATAPGLEARDLSGQWHKVPCDIGTIVINSGDMLKEASGGYFPSTTHRVVNPSGPEARTSRYSMPTFVHPRADAPLSARHTGGSYLRERLLELGLM